ncbi:MAG: GNAT family N-acetyltransferase [Anaerolineales bacterium]|nr:GNAT family N-acetyltransferase [Anaerolineales bacterium]
MKIISLTKKDKDLIHQSAQLLVDAFREHWPEAWQTFEDGLQEIHEIMEEDHILRVAVDDDNKLLGIIGGLSQYDGNVWELHPLAIQPNLQKQGIGRKLVEDFEEQVRQKNGITILLGTDDENNMTSLSNVDLYENLFEKITNIKNIKGHPFEFYQKMGYTIIGVIPDANGIGKPDILMAKQVNRPAGFVNKTK